MTDLFSLGRSKSTPSLQLGPDRTLRVARPWRAKFRATRTFLGQRTLAEATRIVDLWAAVSPFCNIDPSCLEFMARSIEAKRLNPQAGRSSRL
jgi:hypothetical protein